ncbi:hypothetical protein ATO6_08495 [Oceanicola sp. 22II-s10i]|nr:hypothetical protein ATO6_08495 [Oceanicola sp. 22II-s10i]
MELDWGHSMTLVLSDAGDTKRITTIEQAHHWLKRKWPVADRARETALVQVEAAMECLVSVTSARKAFRLAADSAGFAPRIASAAT